MSDTPMASPRRPLRAGGQGEGEKASLATLSAPRTALIRLFFHCSGSALVISSSAWGGACEGTVVMKLASFRTATFLVFAAVVAVPAVAEHAKLLKRHGVVYGVRDFAYQRGCKGVPRGDACEVYKMSGTIVEVRRHPDTRRIDGFVLRMRNGRTQLQNIDPAYFP